MLFNSYDFILTTQVGALCEPVVYLKNTWQDNCVWESIEMIKVRRRNCSNLKRGEASEVKMKPKNEAKSHSWKISIQLSTIEHNDERNLPSVPSHIHLHSATDTRRWDSVDTKYTLWCLFKITLKTICENFSRKSRKKSWGGRGFGMETRGGLERGSHFSAYFHPHRCGYTQQERRMKKSPEIS